VRQLSGLTRLVRGELSGLHRRSLAALITIDVHARDIVADLVKRGTKDVNEFEWQMQLRYYLENEDVAIRQVRVWCLACDVITFYSPEAVVMT
jgi:dynein heavy chain